MIPQSLVNQVNEYLASRPLEPYTTTYEKMPTHIGAAADQIARYERAQNFKIRTESDLYSLAEVEQEIESTSTDRAARREAEQRLADYIDTIPDPHGTHRLAEVVEKLRSCRTSGVVGVKPGGGYMVAWDNKCNMVRLCPDESREEQQRLAEKYIPAMLKWQREPPGIRRIFYGVFTDHNYRPGQLLAGKKHLFEKFKAWQDLKHDACPVEYHHRRPLVTRKRKLPAWPGLKGSLVVQEDPLSASDDWNVHLNVFLLWEGPCDFAQLRQEWGANIHIQQVDPDNLPRALLEAVKYSAQVVPTKAAEKAARHASDAPSMIEWPPVRWIEWWRSQAGFRRTRSYGCLYKVKTPETERLDVDLVQWVGTLRYLKNANGPSYRVNLIPGDNFSYSGPGGAGKNKFGLYENPETGPPIEDW